MEQTPFELTPEQKGLLATLSRETGKPIPALIAEALEELQSHVHRGRDRNGDAATHQHAARTPSVLEIFQSPHVCERWLSSATEGQRPHTCGFTKALLCRTDASYTSKGAIEWREMQVESAPQANPG